MYIQIYTNLSLRKKKLHNKGAFILISIYLSFFSIAKAWKEGESPTNVMISLCGPL